MLAFVEKIWIYFDDNEDSYISNSELVPYLELSFGDSFEDKSADSLFKLIDYNKRGLILKAEMITFFNKLFSYLGMLKKGTDGREAAQRVFGIDRDDR